MWDPWAPAQSKYFCSSQMERLDSPDDFDVLMKYLFSLSAISMKREPG